MALSSPLSPTAQAHQKRDYGADQEHDEEYLRDAGSADRDSTKAEECGNQRNDEEDDGIVKHVRTSSYLMAAICGLPKYWQIGARLQSVRGVLERRT
jgi:hypothetical protein